MKLTRDELLKQKALLEEHLAWLNQKLAQLPQGDESSSPEAKGDSSGADEIKQSPAAPASPLQKHEAKKEAEPEKDEGDKVLEQFTGHEQSTGIQGSEKAGCIIACVILCALVLLGLFILPELLYD